MDGTSANIEIYRHPTLVERFGGISPKAINYPVVHIDLPKGQLRIGDVSMPLSAAEFAFMAALLELRKDGCGLSGWLDVGNRMEALRAENVVPPDCVWFHDFCEKPFDRKEDPRKIASRVRTKLNKALGRPKLAQALVPSFRGDKNELYPMAKIKYKGL